MRVVGSPVLGRLGDALLAVSLAVLTAVFSLQYHPDGWPPFDAAAIALAGVVYLPLAFRRQAPWTVLAVSCAGYAAYAALGFQPSAIVWGPVLGFFTIATLKPPREVAFCALPTGVVWTYGSLASGVLSAEVCIGQTAVVLGIAWVFGATIRELGVRNRRLAELTARLREEQEARARHAVTEERLRIARELHDVVAHHLSVLSVQSGLASYVFDSDPETARGALDTIHSTARRSLEEMRGLLQVLRISPDGTEVIGGPAAGPAPGLERLGELVDRVGAAGVTVDVAVRGARRPLAPGPDLCAYRILQEALTNVLKHAGPAHVALSLDYGPEVLTVRVTDDGGSGGVPQRVTGGGHGLIGMRERVRMYDGLFRAGPLRPGGFEVMFTLPLVT
ncbi:sensor histidine kinase [Streptomyces roseoverticillatus]|uniref:histidine kinase n=1 Tax=Streptomyces roseoverticillatus TaxID=66429 RepID=A0ABV3J4B9_9ACTN